MTKTSRNQKQKDSEMNDIGSDRTEKEKESKDKETVCEAMKNQNMNEEKKKTITVKDIVARKQTENDVLKEKESLVTDKNDCEVSSIMNEMNKTYTFMQMRPITPLAEGLQSCFCINTEDQDVIETINAVKEIEKELRKSTNEKQVEMEEFEIVAGELESMGQQEMDNQGQAFETESEVAERRVEKRKREEAEEVMEQEVRRKMEMS